MCQVLRVHLHILKFDGSLPILALQIDCIHCFRYISYVHDCKWVIKAVHGLHCNFQEHAFFILSYTRWLTCNSLSIDAGNTSCFVCVYLFIYDIF